VATFKYLGRTIKKSVFNSEETKSRLNSGNADYHIFQNILYPLLLSKNVKIKIYETIILPVKHDISY
jgi:hypothetical protein